MSGKETTHCDGEGVERNLYISEIVFAGNPVVVRHAKRRTDAVRDFLPFQFGIDARNLFASSNIVNNCAWRSREGKRREGRTKCGNLLTFWSYWVCRRTSPFTYH